MVSLFLFIFMLLKPAFFIPLKYTCLSMRLSILTAGEPSTLSSKWALYRYASM